MMMNWDTGGPLYMNIYMSYAGYRPQQDQSQTVKQLGNRKVFKTDLLLEIVFTLIGPVKRL